MWKKGINILLLFSLLLFPPLPSPPLPSSLSLLSPPLSLFSPPLSLLSLDFTTNLDEFMQKLSRSPPFKPFGQLLHVYNNADKTFEIYKVENGEKFCHN